MPRSAFHSALAGAALLAVLQGPGTRLTYRVRLFDAGSAGRRELAAGSVSGGLETDLRFGLRADSSEVDVLFQVVAERDSLHLAGEFVTRRRAGRSRRGLPVWEDDVYRRVARLAWGDTARVRLPGGRRLELVLERGFAGGEARPTEQVVAADLPGAPEIRFEAVVRPRRARVVFNLVRGDTVTGPVGLDLVPDSPARLLRLALAGRVTILEVGLTRPEPPASERDRALATDADVVCLRVVPGGAAQAVGVVCGRLNNVARRLPLPGGDTLVATFGWPGTR